jgi:hypothetical protein
MGVAMTTRVVCPHCGEKLVLRQPAIDSTKVKCGNCRGKFYAGHGHGDGARSISVTDDTAVSQALVDTPPPIRVERRKTSAPASAEASGPVMPAWMVPVGLVALAGLTIAGLNSRPSVAPPSAVTVPTTFVSGGAPATPVSP